MHKIMCAKSFKKLLKVITFEEYRFYERQKVKYVSMLCREGRTFPRGGKRYICMPHIINLHPYMDNKHPFYPCCEILLFGKFHPCDIFIVGLNFSH